LPMSPNGKVDRAALPTPQTPATTGGRAPRTPLETTLAELFTEVLGVPGIGIDDNFFTLGGHSLMATRLTGRIRTVLGTDLPARAVFECPTVAGLAARVTQPAAGTPGRPALAAQDRPATPPLSYAQRRLWFLAQLEGPSATYNLPTALRFRGAMDVEALRAALADVLTRHESLRTVFRLHDNEPYQHVLTPDQITVPLTTRPVAPENLDEQLAVAAGRPFDLEHDLPIRAELLRLGPEDQVLALVVHHIAADGWSFAPLARDLTTAYHARSHGNPPTWTPLPVQYIDYTLWQHQLLGDPHDPDSLLNQQLTYWRHTLAGIPDHLTLPTDRPRPPIASHRGDTLPFTLPASLHTDLLTLARRHDATLFMVLHAALTALLTRLGAGTDIPIGAPIAGRTDPALDDLTGFFVNTLVLRTTTDNNPTFTQLLTQTRTTNINAYTHQDLPFDHLVEALNPNRSLARHPLFQV
ncbi:condensation domain-containing protein, partial [Sphaerisporangium sp. B11E5]|uniref:condensation domain-containing protein n=1 Tax=Sphaerisporangium sp. B11E5 TaxID=3153563 RepID=UPI00325EBB53